MREAQSNECSDHGASCEDGRFLVFATYGQLSPTDTDQNKDIYRYDSTTGQLLRISVGEHGYDANGNGEASTISLPSGDERGGVAAQHSLGTRAVSEDGSHIVFRTDEFLSPTAVNGLVNAYEWSAEASGGDVALVSPGSSDQPADQVVISASGRDIFFLTTQGLVAEDTDGQSDVYDAREGGGFPESPAPTRQCAEEACLGPLTSPTPALVPGSATQGPGDNYRSRVSHKKKHTRRPHRRHRRGRAKSRSGRKHG